MSSTVGHYYVQVLPDTDLARCAARDRAKRALCDALTHAGMGKHIPPSLGYTPAPELLTDGPEDDVTIGLVELLASARPVFTGHQVGEWLASGDTLAAMPHWLRYEITSANTEGR